MNIYALVGHLGQQILSSLAYLKPSIFLMPLMNFLFQNEKGNLSCNGLYPFHSNTIWNVTCDTCELAHELACLPFYLKGCELH